jgi:3-hydroxyisobutyrate dehydrogenase-like beta-hydroxyacid dehydrogenase
MGEQRTVAVVGLGRMGRALARRLVDRGWQVTVWNRSPGPVDELVAAGAAPASDPGQAARAADVVVTALADDPAVRSVVLGSSGVAAGLGPGAVLADASTVSPGLSAELADAVGVDRFVAMPILGAPAAVAAGTAVYLAGGAAEAQRRLAALLDDLTDVVRRYPEARLATVAKLTSNFLLLSGALALAEAFAIGRAGGLADDQLRELLGESPMVAAGLRNRFEGLLTGVQEAWWSAVLGAKDASLARSVAEAAGVALPLADVVVDQFRQTAQDHADDGADITAVAERYRP